MRRRPRTSKGDWDEMVIQVGKVESWKKCGEEYKGEEYGQPPQMLPTGQVNWLYSL